VGIHATRHVPGGLGSIGDHAQALRGCEDVLGFAHIHGCRRIRRQTEHAQHADRDDCDCRRRHRRDGNSAGPESGHTRLAGHDVIRQVEHRQAANGGPGRSQIIQF
jgi:hypothetical protein